MTVEELVLKISGDSKGGEDAAKRVGDSLTSAFESPQKAIATVGSLLAGAFSVAAVEQATTKFVDFASTLTDLSQKTGISTTELQKLKFAAEQNGGTLEQVTGGVVKMGKALIDGNAGTVSALGRLGLSLNDLRQMAPAQAFGLISDAIAKVPNPLERSKLAMDLFGKSGADLLPTMTGNLSATMKAAEKLGILLDEQTIKAGDDLGDTLTALQQVGMAIIGKVLAPMLPAFQAVANAMLGAGNIVDYVRDMFDALARVGLLAIKSLIDGAIHVGEFAQKIPGLSRVFGEGTTEMQKARDASTWLAGAIKGLEQGTDSLASTTSKARVPVGLLTEDQKAAAKAAADHAKAIQGLTDKLSGAGAIKAATEMVEALRKAPPIQKLTADAQADINKTMLAAIEVYKAQGRIAPKAMRDLYAATVKLPPLVGAVSGLMKDVGESVKVTIPPIDALGDLLNGKIKTGMDGLAQIGLKIDIVPPKIKKATDTVGELAKALAQLAQISGGTFGALVKQLSSVTAAVDAAKKGQAALTDGLKTFRSGNLLSGIAGIASGVSGIASAAIAGVKAVGGLLSSILGLGTAGRDAVVNFSKTFADKGLNNGFDNLHAKLSALGADGAQLWIKLTQGVGRNNPEEAQKIIDEVTAALAGQDAYMGRLPGLIDKYGLSWEQAGHQAEQARLDDLAKGLIQDFADLSKAGFDVTLITGKMSDAIDDYVHEAMRTGSEIPAAMKPLLQKMADMGTLTDDAGNKLEDLGGLTFAETLSQGFKSVVDAIQQLTKALGGDLGGALDQLSARTTVIKFKAQREGDWPTSEDGETPHAATGGLVTDGGLVPFRFAGGGAVPRIRDFLRTRGTWPDTVPAYLNPGEIVINAMQQEHLAAALQQRGIEGAGSSGDEIHVHVTVDPLTGAVINQRIDKRARRQAAIGQLKTRASVGRSF